MSPPLRRHLQYPSLFRNTIVGASILFFCIALKAHAVTLTDGMNAIDILGQSDQTSTTDPVPVYGKVGVNDGANKFGINVSAAYLGIDTTNHRLYVVDGGNHRVLVYSLNTNNTLPDHLPDYVLGQSTFYGNSTATTQGGMNNPVGIVADPTNNLLFVGDGSNNRVTVYDTSSISNGMNALNVLGQSGFGTSSTATTQAGMSDIRDVAFDTTNRLLFVADGANNRVTVYDTSSISNGMNALNVLGQSGFGTATAATTQPGMSNPRGLAFDNTNYRLYAVDANNNRVTVYNTSSISNGMNAVNIIGPTAFDSNTNSSTQAGLSNPRDVDVDPSRNYAFVVDGNRHRVLIYNTSSISNGMNAVNVLGQTTFSSTSSANTQPGMNAPRGVITDSTNNRLYVSQAGNNRVTAFSLSSISNGMNAVDLLGQSNMTSFTDPVPIYSKSGANDGPNTFGFSSPGYVAFDGTNHKIYVSDSTNNRVLVYNLNTDNTLPNHLPDNVLGQSSFYTGTFATSQPGMGAPQGVAIDATNSRLYVADATNYRILVYNTSSISNGMNALNVLGQTTFSGSSTANTQPGMGIPRGVAIDATNSRLYVAQSGNNRVTVYDTSSISNGMNALNVLGQSVFNGTSAATTQPGMSGPQGVTLDTANNRLYVADATNNRILVYNTSSISNGMNAVNVLGQTGYGSGSSATTQLGLSAPRGVTVDTTNNRLYVADTTNNRVTVYGSKRISGTVYTNEGSTTMGSGRTVTLLVNGAAPSEGTGMATTDSSGSFTIAAPVSAGDVLTLYLDGNSEKGVTVTRASGGDQSSVNIYQNDLLTRCDNSSCSLTNANLATAATNGDSDISSIYSVSASNLTLASGKSLYIPSSHTFAPGGSVTLTTSGNVTVAGTFDLAGNTFTLPSTNTFSNTGTFKLQGNETLTNFTNDTDSGTVSYYGSSSYSGLVGGNTYYNIQFATGTFALSAALTVNGSLTASSGTVNLNGFDPTVTGDFTASSATLSGASSRTLTLNGTTQALAPGTSTWSTLALTGSSGTVTNTSSFTVSGTLSIASGRTLSLSGGVVTLGSSTTFTNNGSVSESSGGYLKSTSSSFQLTDSSYNTAPVYSITAGDKAYITLTDAGRNLSGGSANTLTGITLVCANGATHDSEALTLTETGSSTGVFRYTSGLTLATYSGSSTNNNGTLSCADDDTLTATYTDPKDSSDTQSTTASVTTATVPTAPSSLSGTADSSTAITWTWTDNSSDETGFKIYSNTNTLIATLSANTTHYQETGLSASTSYTRKVLAYNAAGSSSFSSSATTSTSAPYPTAPSSLSGTADSSTAITWTWTDNSSDETGFKLYTSTGLLIATVAANVTSYQETGLVKGTSYARYLVAYNDSGASPATDTVTVTTNSSSPIAPVLRSPEDNAILNTHLPVFSFNRSTDTDDGIEGYTLLFDGGSSSISISDIPSGSSTSVSRAFITGFSDIISVALTDADVLSEGVHTWSVRATDAGGNTTDSSTRSFRISVVGPSVSSLTISPSIRSREADLVTGSTSPLFTIVADSNVDLSSLTFTITQPLGFRSLFSKTVSMNGLSERLSLRVPSISYGAYTITIVVTDTAGNTATITRSLKVLSPQLVAQNIFSSPEEAEALKKAIAEGKPLPPRLPVQFALPELQKQAEVRSKRQQENLNSFLAMFLPTDIVARFDTSLSRFHVSLEAALSTTRTRIASSLGLVGERNVFARVIEGTTHGLEGAVRNIQYRTRKAQQNQVDVAVVTQGKIDRLFAPVLRVHRWTGLAIRFAVDGIRGKYAEPLRITNVVISDITSSHAIVTWQTSRLAQGKINYGQSPAYGEELFESSFAANHRLELPALIPGKKYFFEILANGTDGAQAFDAYYSFSTPAQ